MPRASYAFLDHDTEDGLVADLGEKTYKTDWGEVVPIVKATCSSPNFLSDNDTARLLRGIGAVVIKVDGRPAKSDGTLTDAESQITNVVPPSTYPGKQFKPRRLRFTFANGGTLTIAYPQRRKLKAVIDHILDFTKNKTATVNIELLPEVFNDVMPQLYRYFNLEIPTKITAIARWNGTQSDDLDRKDGYYEQPYIYEAEIGTDGKQGTDIPLTWRALSQGDADGDIKLPSAARRRASFRRSPRA